jgi:outer membrane biogenesis lipoprotein LolB
MPRALLLPIALLLLTGCAEHLVPRSSLKRANLRSNEVNWKLPESVQKHGRSRSHQVFEIKKIAVDDKTIHYKKGGIGMLTVISE